MKQIGIYEVYDEPIARGGMGQIYRGVEKQSSITMTSDFSGAFEQAKTRQEFMNLINSNSHKF